MCHYCCYLAHVHSTSLSSNIYDNNQYFSSHSKQQQQHRTRSSPLTVPLCLVSLTLFFILLNITLVLSQSSRIQQGEQSPNKILEENSRGKENKLILICTSFISNLLLININILFYSDKIGSISLSHKD